MATTTAARVKPLTPSQEMSDRLANTGTILRGVRDTLDILTDDLAPGPTSNILRMLIEAVAQEAETIGEVEVFLQKGGA
jgi:hypothetical protein